MRATLCNARESASGQEETVDCTSQISDNRETTDLSGVKVPLHIDSESYMSRLRRKVGSDLILSPSVAAVIHNREGKLLLQEKSSGEAWSLPAGGIELGESPQEAIIREVMEETGYAVRIHGILGVFGGRAFRYTYPSGDRVEYVVTLFQCTIIGGSGIPADVETKSIRYFGRHDMPELALPYPKDDLFRAF
ncbi:8-oxo-dGTP pyrophosphatase MutT (NUDIX family) [Paraburkholderia tropica]|uniref:NUDIX domain-containing protein n=1 Tax=Paraburkholderia tropica TaxID=92647 RepID=UPI0017A949DC|nr:NUDIX domain-containing protein [Paraburkholderia tropica]MBB3005273.1 8-oxo-dGTP pyrophosphatase MutT (NUDIX family) [Paraburkholderia tropica]